MDGTRKNKRTGILIVSTLFYNQLTRIGPAIVHVAAGQLKLRTPSTGRMMADMEVIMLMHSEARYRGVQGCVSRGRDGIARTNTV